MGILKVDIEELINNKYNEYVDNLKKQIEELSNNLNEVTQKLNNETLISEEKLINAQEQNEIMKKTIHNLSCNLGTETKFMVITSEMSTGYYRSSDYTEDIQTTLHYIVDTIEEANKIICDFNTKMKLRKPDRLEESFGSYSTMLPIIPSLALNLDDLDFIL